MMRRAMRFAVCLVASVALAVVASRARANAPDPSPVTNAVSSMDVTNSHGTSVHVVAPQFPSLSEEQSTPPA